MRPTPTIDKYIAQLFRTTGEKPLLFTLELELLGAPLPINRTLKIPSNMNLGYVQEVLMLSMGWEGYHLKEIRAGGITYFTRYAGGEAPEPIEGFQQEDAFKHGLGDLLKLQGDTFTFVYDMGDDWIHRVTLTEVLPCPTWDQGGDYAGAEIIGGQNACPPEDAGGTDEYASMLKSLVDPEDEEREDYLHWLNRDFDPNRFDLYEARKRVWDFQRVIGEARWGFYHK